jgi:hypothetical protein
MKHFYIVEIRKYYPQGSTPYTEFPCLFLTDNLDNAINYIQNDVNDTDGYTSNGQHYHWYWAVIKMQLNGDDNAKVVKVFDKTGKETTESIMLSTTLSTEVSELSFKEKEKEHIVYQRLLSQADSIWESLQTYFVEHNICMARKQPPWYK